EISDPYHILIGDILNPGYRDDLFTRAKALTKMGTPANAKQAADIAALIVQLDDDDAMTRDAAKAGLVKIGGGAETALVNIIKTGTLQQKRLPKTYLMTLMRQEDMVPYSVVSQQPNELAPGDVVYYVTGFQPWPLANHLGLNKQPP